MVNRASGRFMRGATSTCIVNYYTKLLKKEKTRPEAPRASGRFMRGATSTCGPVKNVFFLCFSCFFFVFFLSSVCLCLHACAALKRNLVLSPKQNACLCWKPIKPMCVCVCVCVWSL